MTDPAVTNQQRAAEVWASVHEIGWTPTGRAVPAIAAALDAAEQRGAERVAQVVRKRHVNTEDPAFCDDCMAAWPCRTLRDMAEVAPPTAGQEGQR